MLRVRVAVVIVAVFFVYGLIEYGMNRLVRYPNFVRLEQESVQHDIDRCQDVFRREIDRVGSVSFHMAMQQDVQDLLVGRERSNAASGLSGSVFSDNRVDLILCVGDNGDVLWQGQCGADGESITQPNADVVQLLLPRVSTSAGPQTRISGVVVCLGAPMIFASHPILPSEGVDRVPGVVIVGRWITPSVLSEFSRELQIALDIWPLGAGSRVRGLLAPILAKITPETPTYIKRASSKSIEAYTTLANVDGAPALLLRARVTRDVVGQGIRATRFAVISVCCTGIALLVIVLLLLETMVVSRISRIAETMSRIGKAGDLTIRLSEGGRDEIGRLGMNINRMLGDLQKAEQSLRDNERQYRALFESAGAAIIVMKGQSVADCNPSALALLGVAREQIIGQPFGRFLPPVQADGQESRGAWNTLAEKVGREGASVVEWRCRRLDGSVVEVELSLSSVSMGPEVLMQLVLRDLTLRQQAEAEKKQLQQQMMRGQKLESLGTLAGGIAHDFNNLLVAVMGNADFALHEMKASSPGYAFFQEIKKAAARASDLTSQLLAYSGQTQFVVQVVDLNVLIPEMASLLRSSISKKANVLYDLAVTTPCVDVDVTQFRQVLINLVTNASDAIGDKPGTITIRTGIIGVDRSYLSHTYMSEGLAEGAYAFFEVSDTGCGMDAEVKGRIFDPFFSTKANGRGLGLAAVQGIVRGLHGAINVSSEPGRGSAFRVLLPLSKNDLAKLPESDELDLDAWRASGTVLVADDEEAMRSICRMILEQIGFQVITAANGQEAVDMFREHSDSVVAVLLDLTMPELGGEQAFEQLLRIRPDVKVILCSGYNETEACSHFTDKKPVGFVQKPFEYKALVSQLKRVVTGGDA